MTEGSGPPRVLVVDDEPGICHFIRAALNDLGVATEGLDGFFNQGACLVVLGRGDTSEQTERQRREQ